MKKEIFENILIVLLIVIIITSLVFTVVRCDDKYSNYCHEITIEYKNGEKEVYHIASNSLTHAYGYIKINDMRINEDLIASYTLKVVKCGCWHE